MKKTLFFLSFVVVVLTCHGQTLRSYSGNVRLHQGFLADYGTLTYTYYEDASGNYVKHGKFNVTSTGSREGRDDNYVLTKWTSKYTANATCKNGWFNGLLTITYKLTANSSRKSNTYITSMTANYKEGVPHGAWSYSQTNNGVVDQSFKVNFTDGMLTGPVSINYTKKMTGQFSSQGEYDGKWTVVDIDGTNREYFFSNGVLIYELKRASGNVTDRTSAEVEDLSRKYANGELTKEDLEERGYKVDGGKGLGAGSLVYEMIYGDNHHPLNYEDIAYEKTMIMTDLFGQRKLSKDTKVMGKAYNYLKKFRDVKSLSDTEFEQYQEQVKEKLSNQYFERDHELTSAKELWRDYFLTGEQKEKVTALYDNYVQNIKPQKMSKIEEERRLAKEKRLEEERKLAEEKRLAEERKLAEERRIAQEKQKKIDNQFIQFVSSALDKVVNVSKDKAGMAVFGADIVISVDYDNNSSSWSYFFSSRSSSLGSKLGSQFKEFCPVVGYRIDSVDSEYGKVFCTLEKYNKKNGSEYWQTQVYFNSSGIDLDRSFVFSKAVRVRGEWDEIRDLQDTIEKQKNLIKEKSGKVCGDVASSYSKSHKNFDLKVSKNLKVTIGQLTRVVNIQRSCLSFIDDRIAIAEIDAKISNYKSAKNILKVYSNYMKSADLSWTPDLNCSDKLRKVIDIQKQILAVVNAPNATELDHKVKNMKDKSMENVLKEIK